MKALYCAIATSVTLAVLPVLQASARPVEPNFFCYMRTSTGQIVDLTASMCGVEQAQPFSRSAALTTGSATAKDSRYDPRYRNVRTETVGGVTRTISGGANDDLSDARDRETVISPGLGSYGDTYRRNGNCTYASDFAADGSRCGGRAASERPGGRY